MSKSKDYQGMNDSIYLELECWDGTNPFPEFKLKLRYRIPIIRYYFWWKLKKYFDKHNQMINQHDQQQI